MADLLISFQFFQIFAEWFSHKASHGGDCFTVDTF